MHASVICLQKVMGMLHSISGARAASWTPASSLPRHPLNEQEFSRVIFLATCWWLQQGPQYLSTASQHCIIDSTELISRVMSGYDSPLPEAGSSVIR